MKSNKNGYCWREECGRNGKRCVGCRAESIVQEGLETSSVKEIDNQRLWPWLMLIAGVAGLFAWAAVSSGCASVPVDDAIYDAADALKLAQCVDDVVKERNARQRTAVAANLAKASNALVDAGAQVPVHGIDYKDPYPDAGTAIPTWFTDGGH